LSLAPEAKSDALREREQDAEAPVWGSRRLNERVWIGVAMVEEGADWKVRKLVIWKVLDVLWWADWQGEEEVEMGEVSVLVGKERRRMMGRKEVRRLDMVWNYKR
jgi:hypothetical protein